VPKLSQALTYGPALTDWQERINIARLRSERAARMQGIMKKHGVASLLVTGAPNCRYVTGLKGPEYTQAVWYVLFFAESDPVVFAGAGFLTQLPDEAPWIREWRIARSWLGGICGPAAAAAEAGKFAAGITAELSERRLKGERVAVIGFDELAQNALRSQGLQVQSGWPLMHEATMQKTEDEVRCTKMAVAIAETAWYRVLGDLRPGVTEDELTRRGMEAAYAAGADDVRLGFRSGPLTFERGIKDTSRILQPGELIYGNLCGTSYLGYRTCLYRTFLVGRDPTPRENDWYRRLLDRIDAVIDAIHPGASTADAARGFAPASTWGYADEAEVLTIEIGHGVGLHQYEMPVINRQWSLDYPQVFEPGMIIAVEGREGEPGQGGVRLENMVLVTQSGVEILDRFPRDRIVSTPLW
jgi:Xaa-Pro aminopeptidase